MVRLRGVAVPYSKGRSWGSELGCLKMGLLCLAVGKIQTSSGVHVGWWCPARTPGRLSCPRSLLGILGKQSCDPQPDSCGFGEPRSRVVPWGVLSGQQKLRPALASRGYSLAELWGGEGGTAEIYCWAQEFLVHPQLGVWGSGPARGGKRGYLDGEERLARLSAWALAAPPSGL